MGVAALGIQRLDDTVSQLRRVCAGRVYLVVKDKATSLLDDAALRVTY